MPAIAIIGASTDRRKYGNKAVRAFHQGGWTVYPVNPGADMVEGLPAYRSLAGVRSALPAASIAITRNSCRPGPSRR